MWTTPYCGPTSRLPNIPPAQIIMQEARQERPVQIGEVMKALYKVWTETNPNLPLK